MEGKSLTSPLPAQGQEDQVLENTIPTPGTGLLLILKGSAGISSCLTPRALLEQGPLQTDECFLSQTGSPLTIFTRSLTQNLDKSHAQANPFAAYHLQPINPIMEIQVLFRVCAQFCKVQLFFKAAWISPMPE